MDYESLYTHYQQTGNITPLLSGAPKEDGWGTGTPPSRTSLLPTGAALLRAVKAAYAGEAPLPRLLYWARWDTVPK